MSEPDTPFGMLERVAQILDQFAAPPHRLNFATIVRRTNLPRASVHRLLSQMEDIGYLTREGSSKSYGLGKRLLALLHFSLHADALSTVFRPFVTEIARSTGSSAFAARLSKGRIDLFESVPPSNAGQAYVFPGLGTRPIHACSSAKAIAAYQTDDIRHSLMDDAQFERFTARTIVLRDEVLSEFDCVRAQGYAVCDEEIDDGVISIACPVAVDGLGVIYSIGIVGMHARLGADHIESMHSILVNTASGLSERLARIDISNLDHRKTTART